jgi:hypothetical protein
LKEDSLQKLREFPGKVNEGYARNHQTIGTLDEGFAGN